MYTKILKQLKECTTPKELYKTFDSLIRQYNLTFNQSRYLLHQFNNENNLIDY